MQYNNALKYIYSRELFGIKLGLKNITELMNELGPYNANEYTPTEALNKKNAVLVPYSLDFDGVNDYVGIPDDAVLDFGTGDFTISFWVYAADYAQVTKGLVCLANATDNAGIITRTTSAGKVETFISADGGGWGEASPVSASALTNGTWNNVVLLRDSGTAKLYINAVLSDSDSNTADIPSYDVTIGRTYEATNNYYFDGKIDEVSMFNKGLTQAEITSLYAADPQNAGDAVGITNLVGYWKFDEGSGEPQDTSGNDNHGVITGATWTVH